MGILTLTQYILLDPILLSFMMASLMGAVKVSSSRIEEFSKLWWFWLIFTGTMLSCCISVKFVGLFIVLLIGMMTVSDLWIILGDMTRPVVSFYLISNNLGLLTVVSKLVLLFLATFLFSVIPFGLK